MFIMLRRTLATLGAVAALTACAQQTPPPAAAPQATAVTPIPETMPEPSPDQTWDVNAVTCAQWIGASDDDRAAVGMFYYGWMAGAHGIHQLKPINIRPNLQKVLGYCSEHQRATVVQAFVATLGAERRRR
jgi:hypothetical protein